MLCSDNIVIIMELNLIDANDVHVLCPLTFDLVELLHQKFPDMLERAVNILTKEGIIIPPRSQHHKVAISSTSNIAPQLSPLSASGAAPTNKRMNKDSGWCVEPENIPLNVLYEDEKCHIYVYQQQHRATR